MNDWNQRYESGGTPWDTGLPSTELMQVVRQHKIQPGRAIELGCGTGSNAVWLAQQGFQVTAVDIAPLAINRAKQRAAEAGVQIQWIEGDVLKLPRFPDPFEFFFDRGCYHAVRRENPAGYVAALVSCVAPKAQGLVLTGNAREAHEPGPPVVSEEEIHRELGQTFQILDLHEFRFDPMPGTDIRFLGWSCLLSRARE